MSRFYTPPDGGAIPGPTGPTGPQGEPGENGLNGTTPFTIVGAYDNGADYGYGDAVYYDGGTYVRTGNPNNPGYPPTPGEINASWTPIADKGDQGEIGQTGPQGESGVSDTTVFTVQGGVVSGTQPTFNGAPLFTGSYIRVGDLVHFQVQVEFTNITSFGDGQYYINLPFPARYNYQVREGCVHDISTLRQYSVGGHVLASESQLALNFLDSNGRDTAFTHNTPFTLAVADKFHVSGTYIAEQI